MEQLESRLYGIAELMEISHREIYETIKKGELKDDTGFMGYNPYLLHSSVAALASSPELQGRKPITLDLGCGNGGFSLMMASLGFPSFGIDINPYLIEKAGENHAKAVERSLIDDKTRVGFAAGNFYPKNFLDEYRSFALRNRTSNASIPLSEEKNPYEELGITLSEAGIIYSWINMEQDDFFTHVVLRETKPGTIFALPNMNHYKAHRSPLRLVHLNATGNTFYLGKRAA